MLRGDSDGNCKLIAKADGEMTTLETNVHGTKNGDRALTPFYRYIKRLWRT